MSDQDVQWRKQGGAYIITAGHVQTSAQARAVVSALESALADWFADAAQHDFRHQIVMADQPSEGLPVTDENALHVDMRSGAYTAAEMLKALQPGWFWLRVADLPDGRDVVLDWIKTAKQAFAVKASDGTYAEDIWEYGDVGIQLGESALMPLALRDPSWIEPYADLLAIWDLSHEVNQAPAIDVMFSTHGWSDAMRRLLILRASVDSQHGPQQVFGDLRGAIAKHLSAEAFTKFYRDALLALRAETQSWLEWPLDDNSHAGFGIDGLLTDIAGTLPDANKETKQ